MRKMDLISRQALLNDIEQYHLSDGKFQHWVEVQPSVEPTLYGYNVEHLCLIAKILQKEGLSPDRVSVALTDIGKIIGIIQDEFITRLQESVNK